MSNPEQGNLADQASQEYAKMALEVASLSLQNKEDQNPNIPPPICQDDNQTQTTRLPRDHSSRSRSPARKGSLSYSRGSSRRCQRVSRKNKHPDRLKHRRRSDCSCSEEWHLSSPSRSISRSASSSFSSSSSSSSSSRSSSRSSSSSSSRSRRRYRGGKGYRRRQVNSRKKYESSKKYYNDKRRQRERSGDSRGKYRRVERRRTRTRPPHPMLRNNSNQGLVKFQAGKSENVIRLDITACLGNNNHELWGEIKPSNNIPGYAQPRKEPVMIHLNLHTDAPVSISICNMNMGKSLQLPQIQAVSNNPVQSLPYREETLTSKLSHLSLGNVPE